MTASPALLDDIMAVMNIAFDPAFGEAWNRRQVSDALALPSTHALVIDDTGRVLPPDPPPGQGRPAAGFTLTRAAAGEEELLLVAIRPDRRRRGLGRKLMEQLFQSARARGTHRMFLEMRCGNPAVHLYRALGFEPIGRRAGYYRFADGRCVDAITFGKSLEPVRKIERDGDKVS